MAEARRRLQAAATDPTSEARLFLSRLISPEGAHPEPLPRATLSDLTRELFSYLIRFRQLAASSQPPALDQVQRDLEDIFARMEQGARDHPPLARSYELVRYPLAALADELVLESEWKQAAQWQGRLLERRLYGTAEAASKVFELAREHKRWPQDAAGIFYLCLGLGFHGHYTLQDPRLAALKAELLARLPGRPAKPGGEPMAQAARVHADAPSGPATPAAPAAPDGPATPAAPAAPAAPASPITFSAQLAEPPRRARRPGLFLAGLGAAGLILAVWLALPGAPPPPGGATAPRPPAATAARAPAPAPAAPPAQAIVLARLTPPAPEPSAKEPLAKEPPAPARAETPPSAARPEPVPIIADVAPPAPTPAATPMAKSAPAQVAATTPPPPPTPELAASPAAPPPPVVLAQTPSAAPAPGRPAEQGQPLGFVIQAGLYVGPIQSNRLAESLTQAGFSAYVLERPRPDNKTRYYVLVGPFAQREMAQQAIAEIKAKLGLTTFLTDPEEPGKLVR